MESVPIVYTISSCPACAKLRADWTQEGIKFEERQIDRSQKWLDEAVKYGDAVPVIVYGDGKVEVGYQRTIG